MIEIGMCLSLIRSFSRNVFNQRRVSSWSIRAPIYFAGSETDSARARKRGCELPAHPEGPRRRLIPLRPMKKGA